MPYERLDAAKIITTVDKLAARISERFPESGLSKVARELHGLSSRASQRAREIGRPHLPARLAAVVAILAVIIVSVLALLNVRMPEQELTLTEFIQVLEAGINDVVLISIAIFFVITLEVRLKRRRAMGAIHEIRSVAHIIDMHQLTKDPERVRSKGQRTEHSPDTKMTRFELERYLDYCSEMLSLCGKVAALYVQDFDDPVAVAASSELEQLCTGLSRKIWQKIMIVQTMAE